MKSILLTAILLLNFHFAFSQAWQWSKQIGGLGNDIVSSTYYGNNIYVRGSFNYYCYIDTTILVSSGYNDLYIAKYDLTCTNLIWLKQIGNSNSSSEVERGTIAHISNNSIYWIGIFYNTLTLDGISITSNGGADAYVAKLDQNGTCIWMKNAGGGTDDKTGNLTLDGSGNIYWSLNIESDSGTISGFNLNKGNNLAKLDNSGNVLAIKNGLIEGGYTTRLKIHNNELYFTGISINDTCIIDGDSLMASNSGDALLAKSDLNGNVIWAKRFGGITNDDAATDLVFSPLNDIYVSGMYKDTMIIDGNSISNIPVYDMYIAKFDNSGINQWIRGCHPTGIYGAIAMSLTIDLDGKIYVIGDFSGTAQFGSFNVTSGNSRDMFLARYDENGTCIGIRHFGNAIGLGVDIDQNNDVMISGQFENTINIGTSTYTSYGLKDGFIAKTDGITGLSEEKISNEQLNIYANPSTGKCIITVPDELVNKKDLLLSIYDNSGKIIQQEILKMNNGLIKLNLETKAKGIYRIALSDSFKLYSGSLLLE